MRLALLLGCMWAAVCGAAELVNLPAIGEISHPKGWTLFERGTNQPSGPGGDTFYWVILQKRTNEFLSFGIQSNVTHRIGTRFYADTAHEMFVDGRCYWTRLKEMPEMSGWSLGTDVTKVNDYEALLYRFIMEVKGGENFLAQGYVLFGDEIVFVQHTSARPQTPELIQGVAYDVMRALAKSSAEKHLRRFKGASEK